MNAIYNNKHKTAIIDSSVLRQVKKKEFILKTLGTACVKDT